MKSFKPETWTIDKIRENVATGSFDDQELGVLYVIFSGCFVDGRPDKGIYVSDGPNERQTLFYAFLGWWICYFKNNGRRGGGRGYSNVKMT